MKVLMTGRTGFIGRNLLPFLSERHEVTAPTRQELDLKDTAAVADFIGRGGFDVVFHGANPNPAKNTVDDQNRMFEDSLRIFMNLYQARQECGKLLYLGSGAEYDKRFDLDRVRESAMGKHLPADPYGLSKFIMNEMAAKTGNVFNLRLFACFGPYDHPSKFITHAIQCCLDGGPVTIRQDCLFDYLHVSDFARITDWFIERKPEYHDYNLCSGQPISLLDIARIVCRQMENAREVQILSEGFNKAYTASNERLMREIRPFEFTSIEQGIALQIAWQRRNQA